MAFPQSLLSQAAPPSRRNLAFAILTFWGLVGVCLISLFLGEFGFSEGSNRFYLIPWCVATGIVIAAPSIYLFYKGRFDPFHPLVFPAWSYFFPGFFIGGLLFAAGLSQPYFASFIQDESYNIPLTFVYVMLGYGGLVIGFALPYGRRIGSWLATKLPVWNIQTEKVPLAGLILMLLGLANTVLAFIQGVIGFQKIEEIGAFDGIIFLLSLFLLESHFILWLYIFRSKSFGFLQTCILAILILTGLARSAFQGNRGGLLQIFILIGFAYTFSGRKLTARNYALGSVLIVVALIGGMVYGTTFRSIKESQEQISVDEYANMITTTVDRLSDQDIGTSLYTGFSALGERLDAVSPLAVVVSNYEALAPYEEIWGINDNIYVDTVTFFIPRVLWPNKPVSIEPSKYADLYFNFPENAFTITPMGDLLRNFGPVGVPIGMIFLGILMRFLYATLIEGQTFSFWRATVFYMILINAISFEGVFSLIIPLIFKVGLVSLLGVAIVKVCASVFRKSS